MSGKLKASPRRWWTGRNLLVAHIAFHVFFLFAYWLSIADILTTGEIDFIEIHMGGIFAGAISNHLVLLVLLAVHTLAVATLQWRKRRQREERQVNSGLSHMTAEEKLELLLDEVAELREAVHESSVIDKSGNGARSIDVLREQNQADQDELELVEYEVEQKEMQQQ